MASNWPFPAQQDAAPNSEDSNFFATEFSMNDAPLRDPSSYDGRKRVRVFDWMRVSAPINASSITTPLVDTRYPFSLPDANCREHSRSVPTSTYVDHTTDPFREASISAGPSAQPTDAIDAARYETATFPANTVWAFSSSPGQEQGSFDKRTNRTIISKEAEQILEQHFSVDPYPALVGIELLARKTNLTVKNVQMWFANTRSRKGKSKGKSVLVKVIFGGRSLSIHDSGSSFWAYVRARAPGYNISFISGPKFYEIE